jgi:ABC-type bacteriocin/lantibiotic exporter with double-glycine peptidase domain
MSGLEIIETLKACAMEENFFRRWSGFFSKTQNSYRKLEIFRHVLLFIPNFVSTITDLILLIFGGFLVTESVISPGVLMAFFILSSEFLSPVEHLAGLSVELQELKAALLRLGDVISYSEESPNDTPEQKEKSEISGEYSVEFQDVSFGYNLLEPPLLEKISFKLSESESIAIVGGSGCGKSTVAKLINGVFKQWNGEILIYGKSRNEYRKEELSDMIASVEQDICLFEASIFDNITLWDTSFSMSDVIKAAKDACIHDVILRRPFGYKSPVEEGGRNFSGGEIQRFEIARALVRNPKVLILDEATSALDCETERRICENIRRRGCVCIIIAHRLSTIKNCENILVLKSGKVEGIGSHEQLLETCESYKELLQNLQDEETAND